MSIVVVKDPVSGKNITLVKGIVNGIFFNDLKEIKDRGKNGKSWVPTHIIKVKIDNDYVGLGLTDKDRVGCKDVNENWHDLAKGMVVTAVVDVQQNGEYTNYNGRAAAVTINDVSNAQAAYVPPAAGAAPAKQPFKKRDNSGLSTGHSFNAAMNLTRNKMSSAEDFLEICKFLHEATENTKKTYAEKTGASIDSYDLGASVGNSILNACKILTVAKKDKVEETAIKLLENIAVPLLDFIKNGDKPVEEEKAPEPEANSGYDDSFDDDIPF